MDSLHQIGIKASPEAVYKALTEQDGISSWWSEHTQAEPAIDNVNEVSFYGGMAVFELRNVVLSPNKNVVWSVEGGPPPWVGTEITWTLSPGEGPTEGQTIVDFAHRGLDLPERSFANINYNWGWYLTSLKFYLEKGKGMPHTDADIL